MPLPLNPILPLLAASILTLVGGIFLLLAALFRTYLTRSRLLVGGIAAWLVGVGTLSFFSFYENFEAFPPRIPVFVAGAILILLWLFLFSPWRGEFRKIPQRYLIGLQSFRIGVELVLSGLAVDHILPVEMSFHGRNWDVLTGVSAGTLAVIVAKKGEAITRAVILGWNVVGLGLLINVVVHGILSTPYPFQVLHLSIDNFVMGYFPLTFLPTFLVPVAFSLHIASLQRALKS